MSFMVALRKELLGQWRSYRLLVASVVLLAFGLLSPLTAKLMPELFKLVPGGEQIAQLIPPPTIQDAVAQYIKNSDQFALILAILMAMGAVAQEKDKGTAALILAKPMPRAAFLLAKFASLGTTLAMGLALAGAACYYYTWILFGAIPPAAWLALNGLLLAIVLMYVALTLLCSTLAKSQAAAGGLAFGLVVILGVLGSLPRIGEYFPARLLVWGSGLVAGTATPAWPALLVTLALIFGALASACLFLGRQEL